MSDILHQSLSHLGFRRFTPCNELTGIVQCFWAIGATDTAPIDSVEKLYPDGGCSLTLVIQPQITAWFECNRRPGLQTFSSRHLTVSARFAPGALFTLFGLSPAELPLSGVDATSALTGDIKRSLNQLLQRLPQTSMLSVVSEFERWLVQLSARASTPFRLQRALALLVKRQLTVTSTAAELGISRRTLERQMTLKTGFNPGCFQQCLRIKNARQLLCNPNLALADIALRCGFYDQSHFTHVFGDFLTETPAEYRLRKLSQFYNTHQNPTSNISNLK